MHIFFLLIRTFMRLKSVIHHVLNFLNVSTSFSEISLLFIGKSYLLFIPAVVKSNIFFLRSTYTIKKIKSVVYSSQGSHNSQLDFCIWQADNSKTG